MSDLSTCEFCGAEIEAEPSPLSDGPDPLSSYLDHVAEHHPEQMEQADNSGKPE